MPRLRKLFFWFFAVLYLTVCPLTVLYALGYWVMPGTGQGIVKTGLLYVSSAPPEASVYLGNQRYTKKTPTILRDLLPGEYQVKLALKHYKPWKRILPIEAEKATVLERVLLLPHGWAPEHVLPDVFEELIPLPATPFILLRVGPRLNEIVVYNWKEQSVHLLSFGEASLDTAKILSLATVDGSSSILLTVHAHPDPRVLWVSLEEQPPSVEDLSVLFTKLPRDVYWESRDPKHLFIFHDQALDRIDVMSQTVEPRLIEGVRGCGLFEKALYLLTTDHAFQRVSLNGTHETMLLSDPVLSRSLFGEEGFFRVVALARDTFLFWGERGALLTNHLPYRLVESGVVGVEVDRQRQRAIVWQRDKLGVVDFSKVAQGVDVFQKGPAMTWLFTEGRRIEQAFWVYEGSHIIFRDQDKIGLLDLETPGQPQPEWLFDVKRNSAVSYVEETGRLYYLDARSGRLSVVMIVPKEALLLFPFPERPEEQVRKEFHNP